MTNVDSFDLDENLIQTIGSKYCKIQELERVNSSSQVTSFFFFHVNIKGLTGHSDKFHLLLCSTKIPFDVIV